MEFAHFASMACLDNVENPHDLLKDSREQIQFVDEAGFAMIWFPEHHFIRQYTAPAPLLAVVDAAGRVKNAKVGAAVIVTAFHDPLVTAGEIALVDHLTDGRFEIGFGRGSSHYEFARFGLSHSESSVRNHEFIQVLLGLLNNENFSYNGKYWNFPPTTTVPRPYQQPMPSMWLAARSPESLRFAIENEFGLMMTVQQEPIERLQAQVNLVDALVDDLGDYPRPPLSISRIVYVTKDKTDALAAMDYVQRLRASSFTHHHKAEDLDGSIRGGYIEPLAHPDDHENIHEELMNRLVVGDPETVVEKLKQIEAMGAEQFVVFNDFGQPQAQVMRSLDLFCSDVMPHFTSKSRAPEEIGVTS